MAAMEAEPGGEGTVFSDEVGELVVDGGESGVGVGVGKVDKDAAVLVVGVEGEDGKVVCIDALETGVDVGEEVLLAEKTDVVAETVG